MLSHLYGCFNDSFPPFTMRKLQKYLIPLQSNVLPSTYYATAYLQIKPSQDEFRQIAQSVSFANQTLHKNLKRLKLGYYDTVSTPLKIEPCSPLTLNIPYTTLTTPSIDIDLQESIVNGTSDLYPRDLNTDFTIPPFRFIGSKIQTNDFHISLSPLLRFEDEQESLDFYKHFKDIINDAHFTCSFSGKLRIYPKFDYTKLFLALVIDKTDPVNSNLLKLLADFARLRSSLNCPGHVIGEVDETTLVDWSLASLHMTVGVANLTATHSLDHTALCYINDVLLSETTALVPSLSGQLTVVLNNQHLRIA